MFLDGQCNKLTNPSDRRLLPPKRSPKNSVSFFLRVKPSSRPVLHAHSPPPLQVSNHSSFSALPEPLSSASNMLVLQLSTSARALQRLCSRLCPRLAGPAITPTHFPNWVLKHSSLCPLWGPRKGTDLGLETQGSVGRLRVEKGHMLDAQSR